MRSLDGVFFADLHRYSDNSSMRGVLGALLRNPGYSACVILRMQHGAVARRSLVLARILRHVGLALFGFDSVPGNSVGHGLLLPHPSGVVIGKDVVVGTNATVLQQVTLGERHIDGTGPHLYPRLGDNVTVGAGAKVLGGVHVQDGVTIGANSVVLSDCPADAIVVGSPARIAKFRPRSSGSTSIEDIL